MPAAVPLRSPDRETLDWGRIARRLEADGDLPAALDAYQRALTAAPDDLDLLDDLGRLALAMELAEVAEAFFRHALSLDPERLPAIDGLARALAAQGRAEAIEVLRRAATRRPEEPVLWNALGVLVNQQGDSDRALVFFEQALRLSPRFAQAAYNRSNVWLDLGDAGKGLAECERAIALAERDGASAPDLAMMRFAAATMRLCAGELASGWDAYESRLSEDLARPVRFETDAPRWRAEDDLAGRALLIFGEQGLGDEVMFASLVPDLIEAAGPEGRVALGVEPRLLPLFRRSFPGAMVAPHATRRDGRFAVRSAPAFARDRFDVAAPLGSLPRRFRRTLADFPERRRYLLANPARVSHWRRVLEDLGPAAKVGLTWRGGKLNGERARQYPPLEAWGAVLRMSEVRFVSLQYGDADAEIAAFRQAFGADVWTPPGIDLRNDLDDLAALACALDLVIGVANATTNLSAACGAETWILGAPAAWPRLGTERYPWYPSARAFIAGRFGAWAQVVEELVRALGCRSA